MRTLILLLLLAAPAAADIQADVEFLASDALRGRASGSPGILSAQNYIVAALKVEGIPVTTQRVGTCQNVIATIEGSQTETYIVVGAHLDHMGISRGQVMNGADDNASGCATILELAKRVNRTKTLRSVVFVWFTGEETGMNGSKDFVNERCKDCDSKKCKKMVFMLNLDMVGHLDNGGARGLEAPGELADLFKKYPFAQKITFRGSDRDSDQRSFNAKCPTIFLNTGLKQNYHIAGDDADTLDYPGMEKVCNYAFNLILQTCGRKHEYSLTRQP